MSHERLTTRTPAPTWEDGVIVGSGQVGAVAYGAPDDLSISLAHERLLLPANPRPAAPDLSAVLGEMRERVGRGDGVGAADLLDEAAREAGYDGLVWTDPLAMCAHLTISTPGGVSDFSRSVDPLRGTASVAWRDVRGVRHAVQLVSPRGTSSVWIGIESEQASSVTVRLALGADDGPASSFAPDYSGLVSAVATAGAPGQLDVRADGASLAVVRATSPAAWRDRDGRALETTLEIPGGGRGVLRADVAVAGFSSVAATDATWDEILDAQTAPHAELAAASRLDLAGRGGATTEETWAAARGGDAPARLRAIELAYASGRSHIIASTGELPPTLQGVWQGTWKPAWSADYTLNGNVQNGAIAGLIPTGTPELAATLFNLVLPFLDDYRDNAARIFGAEGMLLPSRMSTHGKANHFNAQFPHLFWVGCGGWILRFAADLVDVTGDRSLVDDRLWALVEGVLRFGETASVRAGGERHFTPGYSPENTPNGAGSPIAADATADVAIYRDAARAATVLGAARGDRSLDARWAALADDLPAYRIATDGSLAEWIGGPWRENHAHRHATHLYPLWYGLDPAFTGDGERARSLRAAARQTIAAKIAWRAEDPTPPPGRMEMAFGLVQLGLAAAALGDGESALTCAEWLAIDHWTPALTSRHDAGRIFNLDASGGLPALVAAMLVSSVAGEITLLPALPGGWRTGGVTGLRARGGVVVDRLEWDESGCVAELRRLDGAEWLAPDGRLSVRSGIAGSLSRRIVLRAGASATVRFEARRGATDPEPVTRGS